jgi:hypothetical protein
MKDMRQDQAYKEVVSALQQLDLPPERVARALAAVRANNELIAAAARRLLTMDDSPGDYTAWLERHARKS